MAESPVANQYEKAVDRESAAEILARRAAAATRGEAQRRGPRRPSSGRDRRARRARESATDRFVKNVAGSVGRQVGSMVARQVGNAIVRGILGGLLKR